MSKINSPGSEFSRGREIKVILEDMQSQFHVFGEGLSNAREEIQEFRKQVRGEFQSVYTRLDRMDSTFSRFFDTLSDHETRITTLEKQPH